MNARVFRAWTMELVGKKLEDINATAPMALMEVSVKWVSEVEQDLWQEPYINNDNKSNSRQWKRLAWKKWPLSISKYRRLVHRHFPESDFWNPIFVFLTLSFDKASCKSRDKLA